MLDTAYVKQIYFTACVRGTNALLVSERIPVSLLELNTFGHAICALLIYILWWEKPFEIDYPTRFQSRRFWDIFARCSMQDQYSDAVKSYRRERKACLTRHPRFDALEEVSP